MDKPDVDLEDVAIYSEAPTETRFALYDIQGTKGRIVLELGELEIMAEALTHYWFEKSDSLFFYFNREQVFSLDEKLDKWRIKLRKKGVAQDVAATWCRKESDGQA